MGEGRRWERGGGGRGDGGRGEAVGEGTVGAVGGRGRWEGRRWERGGGGRGEAVGEGRRWERGGGGRGEAVGEGTVGGGYCPLCLSDLSALLVFVSRAAGMCGETIAVETRGGVGPTADPGGATDEKGKGRSGCFSSCSMLCWRWS